MYNSQDSDDERGRSFDNLVLYESVYRIVDALKNPLRLIKTDLRIENLRKKKISKQKWQSLKPGCKEWMTNVLILKSGMKKNKIFV